jgi:hypothetical protein
MLSAAMTDLQQQFEAVRQEAFAAGYATAMKEVTELTARAARDAGEAPVPRRNGRGRGRDRTVTRQAAPTSAPVRRPSPRANGLASHTERAGRSAGRRPQRGTNALLVAEVLKSASPRALRAGEIRRALQENGKTMSFPSIGYSLRQLAARNAAKQGGDGKTWRHSKP